MHSTHKIYTPRAFDNYDIIFTIGSFQSDEIKKNETLNNLPQKRIYKTGYFYLDYLVKSSNKSISEKDCILFAPSWNYDEDNLFNKHGDSIVSNLINSGFNVIFRPHPEIIKRNKSKFDHVVSKFEDNKNFILDLNASNVRSMEKASLLITDNSSISIEYSFAFYRPVIFLDYKEKIHNKDYHSIGTSTFESEFKKELGISVSIKDINKLSFICENAIKENKFDNHKTDIFKKKFLSNISNSAEVAAQFLINDNS
jgi:YidC/Oxa1 family membrane protein insertase